MWRNRQLGLFGRLFAVWSGSQDVVDREAIPCRSDALSKAMRHMVRAEEANENVCQVEWHQRKHGPGGRGERVAFKTDERAVAAGKWRAGITRARRSCAVK
jgi:hypothetical protein